MGNGDGDGDGGEKTVHACANACSRQRHPSWDHWRSRWFVLAVATMPVVTGWLWTNVPKIPPALGFQPI